MIIEIINVKAEKLTLLFQKFPQTYSEELGINLSRENWEEIFKWFLASILFGKRISEGIAKKTYRGFEKNNLLTPERILEAGWDKLVEVLDAGGYVRYDFSTATKLLEIMKGLKRRGDLKKLYEEAKNNEDLEEKLKEFKGVGDVTVNIFLRELRALHKVDPNVSKFVKLAAKNLGITVEQPEKSKEFIKLEAALLRLGKNYCGKRKCKGCLMKEYCSKKAA